MIFRRNGLSIYTSPPSWWYSYTKDKKIIFIFKLIKHIICSLFFKKKIGGHYAVTRSLIYGLKSNNIQFDLNSNFIIRSTTIVLSGVDTLQFAISQKKKGNIHFLVAGPNISVLPSFDKNILAAKEVDICLVPSTWVKEEYEKDCPELLGRIRIWAAGVDERYWLPRKKFSFDAPKALIYIKNTDISLNSIEKILKYFKIQYKTIYYGKYTSNQYKELLQWCNFVIVLSRSESQGIALAEAWAMNVPTFSWNPGKLLYGNHLYLNITSAPYITAQTGATWKTSHELYVLLDKFCKKNTYSPRSWVLQHMTDSISANELIDIITLTKTNS